MRHGFGAPAILAVLALLGVPLFDQDAAGASWRVRSREDLRWEGIERQQTDGTCGPAAVATVLRAHFGVPATEAGVLAALGAGAGPTNMRHLQDALARYGVAAAGVRMTPESLGRYLSVEEAPFITRLTAPEPHFTVVLGGRGQWLFLADPALGRVTLAREAFLRHWDGYALLFLGEEGRLDRGPGRAAAEGFSARWRLLRRAVRNR